MSLRLKMVRRACMGTLVVLAASSAQAQQAPTPLAPPPAVEPAPTPAANAGGSAALTFGGASASAAASEPVEQAPPVVLGAEAEAQDAPADTEAGGQDSPEPAWALRNRAYNTWDGSSGGLFVDDPGIGAQGALRLQLALDTYSGDDFMFEGDQVEQNRQTLSFSWTALEFMEIFGSLHNSGSVSTEPTTQSLHSMGDLLVGAKIGDAVTDVLRVGGSLRFFVLNDIGTQEALLDATGIGLRGNLAVDLQGLEEPVPLIARLNLDYFFDNSGTVLGDTEDTRYGNLTNPLPKDDEVRHLITRRERFGLGINRVDLFSIGIGVEFPLELSKDFYLHPIADWRLGMPVNRQDFDCPFFSSDSTRGSTAAGSDDTCVDDAGFEAWPMDLAVGVRIVPPVRGLSATVGADFGLGGTDSFVRELAPTAPFRLMLAVGYDYDAQPEPVVEPPPPPPAEPPPPPTGRVVGMLTDAASGAPVADAVVRIIGSERSALATDAGGGFTSYELPTGAVLFEIRHPRYQAGTCSAQIAESGGDVAMHCSLQALPTEGGMVCRLQDQYGASVSNASVTLTGPTGTILTSDGTGEVRHEALAPGEYRARVDSDQHLMRVVGFTVNANQQSQLTIALLRKPKNRTVQRAGTQIRARGLQFEEASAQLSATGALAVAELADLLLRSPDIRALRVQGNGGEQLALSRALAIKQQLLDAGVADARIEAVGEPAPRVTLKILE